jgi:hypothetical protein
MNAQPQPAINCFIAYAVAALGLFVSGFCIVGSLGNFGAVNDMPEYYAAAIMLLRGDASSIYSLDKFFSLQHQLFPSLTRGVGLFTPPPAVIFLTPLGLLPAGAAVYVWCIASIIAAGIALFLIARHCDLKKADGLWLVGLTFLSGPMVEALRLGQFAPFLLLGLSFFMITASRFPYRSGLCLQVLLLKPQELLPIFLFTTGAAKKILVLTSLLVAALLAVASLLIFGSTGWTAYLKVIADPQVFHFMQPQLTPTLRGQLLLVFGASSLVPAVGTAIGMALSAAAITALGWRHRASDNWLGLCLMVALPLGLVTAVHCHDYDLILLIPAVVQLTRTRLWHELEQWKKVPLMVALGAFMVPFYNDIHYGYLLRGGTINPYFFLLLAGSLLLYAIAWRDPERFAAVDQKLC